MLLALDTSATVRVAVHDGARVLAARVEEDPRRHVELLAPAVQDVLARAGISARDLTQVVVGTGPAPYTGLRVGVVTALVMGEALGIPVGGLCSLDALLATALDAAPGTAPPGTAPLAGDVVAVTDARRREVHWARYSVGRPGGAGGAADPLTGWVRLEGPRVGPPGQVPPLPAVGAGAQRYEQVVHWRADLPTALDPGWLAALAVDRLARGIPLDPPEPLYLRRPDAAEPVERP